jgi:hypothetical protein
MNRTLSGDILRVVLVFALVAFGMPQPLPAATADDAVAGYYFQNGRGIYHVDYGEMLSNAAAALEGTAEFTVTVRQARFFDEPLTVDEPFVFGSTPSTDDVVSLGSTEREVTDSTGIDLRHVDRWQEVVTWKVTGSDREITTSFRVGCDSISMTVPREFLGKDTEAVRPGAVAVIEANGVFAEIDVETVRGLAKAAKSGEALPELEALSGLEEIAESFDDLPRLVNGVTGLWVAEARARVDGPDELVPWGTAIAPQRCELECVACAGALLALVGSLIGLVAACGATVFSGGAAAVLCIAAFVGVGAAEMALMGSCAMCAACIEIPPLPPTPTDPCPCDDEEEDAEDCPCANSIP